MEMIDLVYRFCSSWIFYHIVWCSERTGIHLNLILSPRRHWSAAIVHSASVSVTVTKGRPPVSAEVRGHTCYRSPKPSLGAVPAAGPPPRQTSVLGAASWSTESCKKNKLLLKNLKGKRGSVYRVRVGRKTAPRPADRVKID